MAKHDNRHLTTEQLSACIDNQLSAQEQAICQLHLQTCEQCQSSLATLQQTVALLKALPAPTVPRSFALPAGTASLQEQPARQQTPATTNSPPSRRLWPYYLQRSLRAASAIAAVIGLVFLLSGILPTLHFGGGTPTSSGNVSAPSSAQHLSPSTATAQKAAADHQSNSSGVRTPTALPKNTPVTSTRQPTGEAPPALLLPNLNTDIGRQEVGWLLIALGVVAILLTRRKRRRLEA